MAALLAAVTVFLMASILFVSFNYWVCFVYCIYMKVVVTGYQVKGCSWYEEKRYE